MKTKRQKHKLLFGLTIFLALALLLYFCKNFLFSNYTRYSRNDDISQRAQEFIAQQQKDEGSLWQEQNFTPSPSSSTEKLVLMSNCFSVEVPFIVHNTKVENEAKGCTVRTRVTSPASQLVISSSTFENSLDEVSSVTMRRLDTVKFKEKKISIDKFDESLRFDEQDATTLFFKKGDLLITLAFTGMAQKELLSDDIIESVVSSLVLH